MSSWKEYKLVEVAKNASRRFDFSKHSNVIFINTGDVLNNQFLHKNYSIADGLPGQAKKAIQKGDILYSEIRPGNGRYLLVGDSVDDYVVSTKFMVIESNQEVILPEFLFLLLISNEATEYFKVIAESRSGTFPQITFDSISHYELKIPSKDIQQSIVDNVFVLDKKIELNTQINQTLEQIAQTIFKSWFIDFDPVHAKANALASGQTLEQATQAAMAVISGKNTQELHRLQTANPEQYQQLWEIAEAFPSGFDEEGMPRWWEIQKVENIVERLKSKQKLKKEDVTDEGQIPVFEQGAKILMGYCDEPAFNASLDEPMFIFGDHTCITKLSTKPFSIYQNVIALKGKKLPTYWVYYAVKDKQEFQEYRRHWMEFIVKEVIIPDNLKLCNYFSEKVANMCVLVDKILEENRILSEIRDELLPKLLSGDISNE
ncbi:restriction modification system DNA specificity domain-containing protein [[Actinobacillus] rossii]|uniref:Restriction modification system DNA specificity domain-containing protein n=1 Tax=[Actinobacillus] rossii TaxID=123820 RepID=A0A380TWN6_9PAST|nr:restriction modification system DNA specificity domain-containing protein [[Actinobacillus] rossii]